MRKSVNQVDKLYFEIHVLFKQLFPYYIFFISNWSYLCLLWLLFKQVY